MILLTLAGWTSIPLFLKHFSHLIDPWTANGWRYGASALLWLPVLLIGARRGTLPKGLWRAALVPSVFNIGAQVCFAIAPYMVGPGLMTFSMRLQIVFLTVGAAMLFPAERRIIKARGFIIGISMVLLGTIATLAFKPGGLGGGTAGGVALSIAAGLLYACYGLAVRKNMHGLPPFTAFAAVSQYTAAAIAVLMLIFGDRSGATAIDLGPGQFWLLMLSAVIGIGIGHTLYFASIARLGLAVSAGVVQLQPITVSIGSFLLFDEKLTLTQWCGGLLAVAGAAIMLVAQHRAAVRHAAAADQLAAGTGAGEAGPEPAPVTDPNGAAAKTADDAADSMLCGICGTVLEGVSANNGHAGTEAADANACPTCGSPSATPDAR